MQIGIRPKKSTADLVDLLNECHGRIRNFAALARKLGETGGVPRDEVVDAATRVARYFREALPLHVRDEEETILPRLRGRDADLDATLDAMCSEHRGHEDPLTELLALCDELVAHPERHAERAGALTELARRLEREFEHHLAAEERVIFPAIAKLEAQTREAMIAELRARRTRSS
jgi:iron-sulfur cluster repair protein YtfE (RIC family)